jgi:hypothetical protein
MVEEVRKVRRRSRSGFHGCDGGRRVLWVCGASYLVANRGTLTGSIGVTGVLQPQGVHKIGVDFKTIKSGSSRCGSSSRHDGKDQRLLSTAY